jgi:hypothetical protein
LAPFLTNTSGGYGIQQNSNFPLYRGYTSTAEHNANTPADPTPYNFMQMTHLNWFTPAFLCRRGGLRLKYLYENDVEGGYLAVNRLTENGGSKINPAKRITYDGTSASSAVVAASRANIVDMCGGHITPVRVNPVLEVELPYASRYRFSPARLKNLREPGSEFTQQHTVMFPLSGTGSKSRVHV